MDVPSRRLDKHQATLDAAPPIRRPRVTREEQTDDRQASATARALRRSCRDETACWIRLRLPRPPTALLRTGRSQADALRPDAAPPRPRWRRRGRRLAALTASGREPTRAGMPPLQPAPEVDAVLLGGRDRRRAGGPGRCRPPGRARACDFVVLEAGDRRRVDAALGARAPVQPVAVQHRPRGPRPAGADRLGRARPGRAAHRRRPHRRLPRPAGRASGHRTAPALRGAR